MAENQAPAVGTTLPPLLGVKPPGPLIFGTRPAESWKLFRQRWEGYSLLSDLDKRPREYQIALLLHSLSDEALTVYNGLDFGGAPEARTVTDILDKLESFAIGQVNVTYELYKFYQRSQEEDESFDKFYSAIRFLSKSCSFCGNCIDSMLKDRIVLGIRDKPTQTELLKVNNLTLLLYVHVCVTRTGWKTRPRPKTVILPIKKSINQSIKVC